uniref:SSD domain-containing protein n=1 Tax=Ditylenchus dipsaci TaxID=166011 RepID=A0A915EEC6_9BILA
MFDNQHDLGKTVHGDKPRVIRILHKAYSRWATFVVGHAWWLICICLLASALGAYKMVTTKRENSIRGYTPYGARALHEFDVRDQEKNNLLTEESLKEAVQIDNFIQNNLTIFNHVSGRKESFNQICRKFCTINEPVRQFYNGYKHQMDRLAQGDSLNYRIKLDYPIAEIFGRSVSLQPNFLEEDQVASLLAGNNSSTQNETAAISAKLITNMDRVEMIVLLYRAERIGGWSDAEIRDYEMSVSNYFKKDHVGKHIRVMTISSTYVSRELDRAAKTLMPFVGLGLLVMICCSVVTCTLAALFTGQFSFYRLPLTIIACLCPFMASGTPWAFYFYSVFGTVPSWEYPLFWCLP